jgi:MoaA/NifB/PqqE/SkfB family radical SAM enzyme
MNTDLAETTARSADLAEVAKVRAGARLNFAWLELTQNCDLRCRHCYTSSSPSRAHGIVDWFSVLDQLEAIGCRSIQFIGGEPTRHPDFPALLAHARHLGFGFIEVYTNLVGLTAERVALYARSDVRIATSFYSDDPAAHDAITLTQGSFEKTVASIDAVLAAGLPLRVGLIDQAGDPAQVARTIAFLTARGVAPAAIRVDRVRGVGRGGKGKAIADPDKELCGRCGINRLAIAHDGNCFACVFARHRPWGNVLNQPLREIAGEHLSHAWALAAASWEETCEPMADPPPCTPDESCNPDNECSPDTCAPTFGPGGPCTPDECVPSATPPECGPGFG